ncbi:hypothetical protein SAMN05443634_1215 [Chishuiella changwenlii]|uniref:Lipocalin-like domain-containing protein n=1 Tax=Chishuiella changwenlii TaxID=1434701 RepID=A0A1M7D9F8_9FLAO|nr:hypothetical protein [Chishuiella changwenlii]GGF11565.1 hypothetical protein GCM10010984_30750 [Chishuiella changwenlii]SHL75819.1 hypothetical protein SAMN05443634_1215 [Chishuiella changwenlii]
MKKIILILITNSFLSCNHNTTTTTTKLIGEWTNEKIILKINKSKIQRIENGNTFNYESYKICGDTLKMIKQGKEEYHIIRIVNNKLIFSPIDPFEKDIELIDESVFIKNNK